MLALEEPYIGRLIMGNFVLLIENLGKLRNCLEKYGDLKNPLRLMTRFYRNTNSSLENSSGPVKDAHSVAVLSISENKSMLSEETIKEFDKFQDVSFDTSENNYNLIEHVIELVKKDASEYHEKMRLKAELVESTPAGNDKLPTKNMGVNPAPVPKVLGRPRKPLSIGAFVDALKEDKRREHWNQTEWGTYFNCSRQTIGRRIAWKEIQNMLAKKSRSVVQRTGEGESASTEDD